MAVVDAGAGPSTGDILEVLQRYWGYAALRPLQEQAIRAACECRDSLVVLPTGGGKSLCYQIPPVLTGAVHVVISPLISLMKDQVDGLRQCGYQAAALYSGMEAAQMRAVERGFAAGEYRLLFVAPERALNPRFVAVMERAGVTAFAIDEAHCISHWGHDFRPEYRRLAQLQERFPQASVHAFTATATARVRTDIVEQLRLRDPLVLVGSFDRPNLAYRVVPRADTNRQTLEVIQRHGGQAAIVYCISRAEAERMGAVLQRAGIRAAPYHAGMEADHRRETQEAFAAEQIDVVTATVAFGMGIDRSDVRCVVHAGMPKSVEHYQQETGRAGRDGLEAECVLLYSAADVIRWESLIEKSAAEADAPPEVARAATELLGHMRRYCSSAQCRHRFLSEYFGQTYAAAGCGACDVCLGEIEGLTDATVTAQKILSCVVRTGERFGVEHIADVLLGADTERVRRWRHQELSTYALLKGSKRATVTNYVYQLIDTGVLERSGDERPVLRLNSAAWEVLRGRRSVRLLQAREAVAPTSGERAAWEGVDRGLFESLRALRRGLAQSRGVPPFVICGDATLREIARLRPTTLAALRAVRGIGDRKLADFGALFIEHVRAHAPIAMAPDRDRQ